MMAYKRKMYKVWRVSDPEDCIEVPAKNKMCAIGFACLLLKTHHTQEFDAKLIRE